MLEQDHKPSSFFSEAFRGRLEPCSVDEIGALAVMEGTILNDSGHISADDQVRIFTDDPSFTYIFGVYGNHPEIMKHFSIKLMGFAPGRFAYRYVIEILPVDSVWDAAIRC